VESLASRKVPGYSTSQQENSRLIFESSTLPAGGRFRNRFIWKSIYLSKGKNRTRMGRTA